MTLNRVVFNTLRSPFVPGQAYDRPVARPSLDQLLLRRPLTRGDILLSEDAVAYRNLLRPMEPLARSTKKMRRKEPRIDLAISVAQLPANAVLPTPPLPLVKASATALANYEFLEFAQSRKSLFRSKAKCPGPTTTETWEFRRAQTGTQTQAIRPLCNGPQHLADTLQ